MAKKKAAHPGTTFALKLGKPDEAANGFTPFFLGKEVIDMKTNNSYSHRSKSRKTLVNWTFIFALVRFIVFLGVTAVSHC